MKPCKHLDYDEAKYSAACTLEEVPGFPGVRCWRRKPHFDEQQRRVQFCGLGRGRINDVFACYNGEMRCYEPAES